MIEFKESLSTELLFKAAQQYLRPGDMFFDCFRCGKVPRKLILEPKKIGFGFTERMWWQFTCPGCGCSVISPLWRL